jgi:hypothetical protein
LLTMRSGTRTLWIMLLCTNKANIVFGFVYESSVVSDISPLRAPSLASQLPH